jgi:4-hydroxy-4-methyl-2-oxoglutarate aldolase
MSAAADDLRWLSSALLADALGATSSTAAIHAQVDGARAIGPAYTFGFRPGDNLAFHVAVAAARPGDVLVAVCGTRAEAGVFGELLATAARHRGIAGVVTDGLIRDRADIAALGFPAFAGGRSPRKASKDDPGRQRAPVQLGRLPVSSGDLVCADDDGIVVVPSAQVSAALTAARDLHARESAVRERLGRGETTLSALGLDGGDPEVRSE